MPEREPRYGEIYRQALDKALDAQDRTTERLIAVFEMDDRGGDNCAAHTVAFTHPEFAHRYRADMPLPNLLFYVAAQELVELSGEDYEASYFGNTQYFDFQLLDKESLVKSLQGANAVWFGNAEPKSEESGEYEGYNHMLGIVPAKEPEKYIVYDSSGQVKPLTPITLDELYEDISTLPVGDDYMQTIISFRDKPQTDS